MVINDPTWPASWWSDAQEPKRRYFKVSGQVIVPELQGFCGPGCLRCGSWAGLVIKNDSCICADPKCRNSVSYHIELVCPNPNCTTIAEQAR